MKPTVRLLAAVTLLTCSQVLSVQEKSVTGTGRLLLLNDRAASHKLYLTADRVTYIAAGRRVLTLPQPEASFRFNDASFLPGKVLVSTFSNQKKAIVLSAYTTAGEKVWTFQRPQVCGPPFIEVNGFEQYVKFSSNCFESQFNTFDHILNTATGKEVASGINSSVASALNARLLVSYGKYIPRGYIPAASVRPQLAEPISAQRAWIFSDVPRTSCEPLRVSRNQWISGESIYSENEDRCGRYTLRFHWTDLKRPRPEVIPGWSLSAPAGLTDARSRDATVYLRSGERQVGSLMCPLLSRVAQCPTPEQRIRFSH